MTALFTVHYHDSRNNTRYTIIERDPEAGYQSVGPLDRYQPGPMKMTAREVSAVQRELASRHRTFEVLPA